MIEGADKSETLTRTTTTRLRASSDGTTRRSGNGTYGYLFGFRFGELLTSARRKLFCIGTTNASGPIACQRRMQPSRMHHVRLRVYRDEGPASKAGV